MTTSTNNDIYGGKGSVASTKDEYDDMNPSVSSSRGFDYRGAAEGDNKAPGFDYRTHAVGDLSHSLHLSHGDLQPITHQSHSEMERHHHSMGSPGAMGVDIGFGASERSSAGLPKELLKALVVDDPEISEDTEAAEALRANANVKVSQFGKVARSVNAQSVRKGIKMLTLRAQSGNKRGKPPRIPPGAQLNTAEGAVIYNVDEEASDDLDSEDSSVSFIVTQELGASGSDDNEVDDQAGKPLRPTLVDTSARHRAHDDDASTASPLPWNPGELSDQRAAVGKGTKQVAPIDGDAKDIPAEVVAATMEAGRKIMGALDPHNMLQLQRWRRTKKKGKKKRKSYVKGKVIDGRHELYTLSIAVMLGVRTSIARTNTIIASADRRNALTTQDFMAEEKYEFSPKGSTTTPPHKLSHTFKFKDYAPVAFAYLRRMFGVNEFDFLLSVCGNANFIEFISNAKSGQFFFYSSDGKYMIKTMTNTESKFLRRILPHYFRHCTQNPNTLITKFLGMYRVKLYHLRRNVKFVIMNSVYYTDKSIQTFYDLKGSEQGRQAKPGQDVLKDNDLRATLPEEAFSFPPPVRERLRAQIVADGDFLRRMQIMDYSMLIGIHHIPPKSGHHRGGSVSDTGLKIKERQEAIRQGSHTSDPLTAAASAVQKDTCDGGSHTDGESVDDKSSAKSVKSGKPDSSRKLMKEIKESTFNAANMDFAGLLDEDDDCSYLESSEPYKELMKAKGSSTLQRGMYDDVEIKKEQTVEQIYWPFHRFFDINGLRRMKPKPCFRCSTNPCSCARHAKLVKAWKIPDFTPPLSERKDGGLMMDTDGINGPMSWHGPQGDLPYENKIFFMGIIDILQQYNSRKRVETTYRKFETHGEIEPSCVSPREYADRFVRFFDEYSGQSEPMPVAANKKEETQTEVRTAGNVVIPENIEVSESDSTEEEGYQRPVQTMVDSNGKRVMSQRGPFITS